MPMPLWAMFPPLRCDARGLMLDLLPDFLAAYRMKPYHTMPIDYDEDEVVCLDAEGRETGDLASMLATGEGRLGVVMNFSIPEVGRHASFSILDRVMPATLCVSIEREILAEDHDRFGNAGWFVGFLSALANKLGTECCLSTRDGRVSQVLESLDVPELLAQLKSGQLLESVTPVILVVREDLASTEELAELINERPELLFRLKQDGAYHVLWSMRNAVWNWP